MTDSGTNDLKATIAAGDRAPVMRPLPDVVARYMREDGNIELDGMALRLVDEIALPTYELPHYMPVAAPPRLFRVAVAAGDEGDRTRLLWVGDQDDGESVRRIAAALDAVDVEVVAGALPHSLDMFVTDDEVVLLLTSDHLHGLRDFTTQEQWRCLPARTALEALIQLSGVLIQLHEAGFCLGGVRPEQMLLSLTEPQLIFGNLGQLLPTELMTRVQAADMLRKDIQTVGQLLLEAVTGGPIEERVADFERVLDDAQVLVDSGLALPGLAQVAVATLTREAPFAYAQAADLLAGLLQMRAEMTAPLEFRTGLASTAGNFPMRRTDQDSCGVSETRVIYHGVAQHLGFYAVADGVGGEEHGERASQVAVASSIKAFHRSLEAYPFDVIRTNVSVIARTVVKVAAAELAIVGESDPDENRGATTFTGAVIAGDRLGLGHVGDSRAYLIREGAITSLTRDHTLASMKLALGEMTGRRAHESSDDERRISRYLGTSNETPMGWIDAFDPRLFPRVVKPRDWTPPAETPGARASHSSLRRGHKESPTVEQPVRHASENITRDLTSDRPEGPGSDWTHRSGTHVFNADRELESRSAFLELLPGDGILLMSDGLYGELDDDQIGQIIADVYDPQVCAHRLLDESLKGLSMDNVTVVMIRVQEGTASLRV
jgi:PPM family protein phosphatase